ncbi:MAG: 5'-nucleotidase, lipoprotein e(P4) family, partial [Acidobacteria bacterium]|nr:5'-nucleotidase, lipoprotein e(P4) family [Acidobacteriota bacterium]
KAAEYRALTYQAFNLAQMQLDADKKLSKKLPRSERKRPRAIVIDIDETVIDNSPAQAKLIKENAAFTIESFFEWKKAMKAKAVPGALDFLKYAKSKGFDIYYVSNVPDSFKEVTVAGLDALGFPDADNDHVLLITDSSSKEPRRRKVGETPRIVMFIGDSLNDLSEVFEGRSVEERFAEVDKARKMWGTKFIVIPNPTYGAWESAIYEGKRLSDAEKKVKRHEALETY